MSYSIKVSNKKKFDYFFYFVITYKDRENRVKKVYRIKSKKGNDILMYHYQGVKYHSYIDKTSTYLYKQEWETIENALKSLGLKLSKEIIND